MEHPRPDDKNWTWVLDKECPECGFVASSFDRSELGGKIRTNVTNWRRVLEKGEIIQQRPPTTAERGPIWSALEYGAHVRDVYEVYTGRLLAMLKASGATFADWDQDVTAMQKDYASEDPSKVMYTLAKNAGEIATIFDRLRTSEWSNTGLRSDGSHFTVESLGRYMLHDPVHHLWDVEQGFEALAQ